MRNSSSDDEGLLFGVTIKSIITLGTATGAVLCAVKSHYGAALSSAAWTTYLYGDTLKDFFKWQEQQPLRFLPVEKTAPTRQEKESLLATTQLTATLAFAAANVPAIVSGDWVATLSCVCGVALSYAAHQEHYEAAQRPDTPKPFQNIPIYRLKK